MRGFPPEQAEAHVAAQADFLTQHILSEVATKDDLAQLRHELKAEMGIRFAEVDTKLAQLETRITNRMIAMTGFLAALMALV